MVLQVSLSNKRYYVDYDVKCYNEKKFGNQNTLVKDISVKEICE